MLTFVRHTQDALFVVLDGEAFVWEAAAVDGVAIGATSGGDITSLNPTTSDYAEEGTAFVGEFDILSRLGIGNFRKIRFAEVEEVLACPGAQTTEELEHHTTGNLAIDADQHPTELRVFGAEELVEAGLRQRQVGGGIRVRDIEQFEVRRLANRLNEGIAGDDDVGIPVGHKDSGCEFNTLLLFTDELRASLLELEGKLSGDGDVVLLLVLLVEVGRGLGRDQARQGPGPPVGFRDLVMRARKGLDPPPDGRRLRSPCTQKPPNGASSELRDRPVRSHV